MNHILVDIHKASSHELNNAKKLETCCLEFVESIGMTVIHSYGHGFSPQGASVNIMLAESHLSLHTWPERGTACLDIFSCREIPDLSKKVETLVRQLEGTILKTAILTRSF